MRVADFHFDLPEHLIARHPLSERRASRLLVLDGASGEMPTVALPICSTTCAQAT